MLDSHQHFWAYDETEYPWISRYSPLHRDWLPHDMGGELAKVGVGGSVAVQARQSLIESHWLLTLADHFPAIRGVVGWVDLRSDGVAGDLAELAKHPRFVGVRHVAQDEPDARFLLGEAFLRGIGELKTFGLAYDILIYPQQLPAAIKLAAHFPDQRFVLDHLAKPLIRAGTLSPWREQIRELAKAPHVFCKVSGMVTEAKLDGWRADDFCPYLDVVFEAFGAGRVMWGSDWPVCLLAGSYEQVFGLVDDYTRALPASERAAIFGGNAARFYCIQP